MQNTKAFNAREATTGVSRTLRQYGGRDMDLCSICQSLYVLIAAASAWAAISLPAVEDMDAG